MGRVTARRPVVRLSLGADPVRRPDTLVVEEPLEIRVNGIALAITMRTPGNDVDLASGFLVGEGAIHTAGDVVAARVCAGTGDDGANTYNVLDVTLAGDVPAPDASLSRNFYTTSSCGICGKTSIDAVRTQSAWQLDSDRSRIDPHDLAALPDKLRTAQRVFDVTGGLHGAALASADGELLVVREDVGRHNAVDKVIGWALREGTDGGNTHAGCGFRAEFACRRPCRRGRHDARRFLARYDDGRLRRRRAAGARARARLAPPALRRQRVAVRPR